MIGDILNGQASPLAFSPFLPDTPLQRPLCGKSRGSFLDLDGRGILRKDGRLRMSWKTLDPWTALLNAQWKHICGDFNIQ